jgi:hypothetical protein
MARAMSPEIEIELLWCGTVSVDATRAAIEFRKGVFRWQDMDGSPAHRLKPPLAVSNNANRYDGRGAAAKRCAGSRLLPSRF